ncbi:MAG: hypothetical protein US40_C0021G0003 [Candidatus Roizmanbacteria bacterium GW2011_GWC2_37_13]|uniref:Uncharacterized protein n=1 Tax=Candidatus Roizmanbacteria bacterium GW2011_GWC2_37_13 TaxID=1618486 RepID=A0A0G0IIB4_9BACT|nr:MAG: hypothetical protein US40_C0021G0003 [Candidatus Roizmanbacteria bacterium GW2011_GWC2_37_13]
MSKAQQFKLNVNLSDRLANYLITQPDILKKYSGCSYIVFSYKNEELGKTVVRAQETSNPDNPWILTPIYN